MIGAGQSAERRDSASTNMPIRVTEFSDATGRTLLLVAASDSDFEAYPRQFTTPVDRSRPEGDEDARIHEPARLECTADARRILT